jgi:hypothetical protein
MLRFLIANYFILNKLRVFWHGFRFVYPVQFARDDYFTGAKRTDFEGLEISPMRTRRAPRGGSTKRPAGPVKFPIGNPI